MELSSKSCIDLAAKGDQAAISELYNGTYHAVYRTVKALIRDEDTVLDVVQDSYIKAFQSLEQLEDPTHFPAWIKRIAANKAKDYLKKKKPMLFSELEPEDGGELPFRDERQAHLPEAALDRQETTRLMNEILDTLSEEQRMVIGLYYYEELSVREIAELLGCSENTVKSRLNYGRKKVETKVLELEKQGTKLYSLAPIPFLLWLFRNDAALLARPSAAVLEEITANCAVGTAGAAARAAGVKAAAGAGSRALAMKVAAGALAVTVVGGGAGLVLHARQPVYEPHTIVSFAEIPPAALEDLLAQTDGHTQTLLDSGHTLDIRDGVHDFTFWQEHTPAFSSIERTDYGYFAVTDTGSNLFLVPCTLSVTDAAYVDMNGSQTISFDDAVGVVIYRDLYLESDGTVSCSDYVEQTCFYSTRALLEDHHIDPLRETGTVETVELPVE